MALCRLLETSHVNYHRWKKARSIKGPYKKIVEEFLKKYNEDTDLSVKKSAIREDSGPASDIAVIGVSCFYPGARNPKELWENILSRRVQFRRMLDQRMPLADYYDENAVGEKSYAKQAAFIDGFDFDWSKWRIPKQIFESTDISHWLALDTALKALQNSGYADGQIATERTGVLVGNTLTGEQTRSQTLALRWPFVNKTLYAALESLGVPFHDREKIAQTMEPLYKSAFYPITEDSLAGGLANTIAGRICNYFNFKGGGYIVDGACASSLLAVATAANALKMGDLDLALAGGVDISLDPFELVGFSKAGALTKDQMRVYDRQASGFIPGEGCGFVVLKRLQDALRDKDYIYAVIKGWGISSDGKGGIMEPSARGQSFAIRRAYQNGYRASDLDFIEGHGTGTTRGDRAELEGMALAIRKSGSNPPASKCGVTSFKSIVGHTKAAAGIGGLIKAVLAVNQRIIPPIANCHEPNQIFEGEAGCLYPVMQGEVLERDRVVRAGVSAAGFGGINCHITLQSKDAPSPDLIPPVDERAALVSNQKSEIFVFCSKTTGHLIELIRKHKAHLRFISQAELADFACWLNSQTKTHAGIRAAVVTDTPEHLYEAMGLIADELSLHEPQKGKLLELKASNLQTRIIIGNAVTANRIGFLYPGQASQRLNMTRHLFERYEWARDLVKHIDQPLKERLYKPLDKFLSADERKTFEQDLSQTEFTQPAVVYSSLVWTRFLSKLGIEPAVAGGHSLGELPAFHKAGAFDDRQLLQFAELRGRLMALCNDSRTGMAGLFCSEKSARKLLSRAQGDVILANINAPNQMIVSGDQKGLDAVIRRADREGIQSFVLPVSGAFHSSFMHEAAETIKDYRLLRKSFTPGTVGLYSCMKGERLSGPINLASYFSQQVISPINFIKLVQQMSGSCDLLLEVGPASVLTDLVRRINKDHHVKCIPLESTPCNDRDLNHVLAEFFVRGMPIRWEELYRNRLVKAFIPPHRRKFLTNQCERPLAVRKDRGTALSLNIREGQIPEQQAIQQQKGPIAADGPGGLSDKELISELLLDLVHKMTGFDRGSLNLDLKLLDDLNLDSIKAAELIAEATKILGIPGILDPSQHSNKKLSQIRDILAETTLLAKQNGRGEESDENILKRYLDKNWVRDFVVEYRESRLKGKDKDLLKRLGNISVICEEEGNLLVQALENQLLKHKIKVRAFRYDNGLVPAGSCLVGILPAPRKNAIVDKEHLRQSIERLHRIIKCATQFGGAEEKTVVLVQFGNGTFGEQGPQPDVFSCCAKSLASTLHLEWPELRIKILDFNARSRASDISRQIINELQVNEPLTTAGYDKDFIRRVPVFHAARPGQYKKRNIPWSKKDVVLVTGGAKGITAQCAFAFAKKYQTRMILVGRSRPSKTNGKEIKQTLSKYKMEGLEAFYYSADVTRLQDMERLIKEVEKKQGRITAVIHGAGLNSIKRLRPSDPEDVFAESQAKIFGAVHLIKALEKRPLKLFAAFNSIIGVTGMEGSGWYGYANEVLNLVLRQFQYKNKTVPVVSLAYSVWDKVGMGVKLGTIDWLSQMGMKAIPVEEGVKHFLRLIEKDSGSRQTVIMSRTANLTAWKALASGVPNDLRFIDRVKVHIPCVELIAQCHLTTKDDAYVLDHNWKGSLLFPLVFGLEAMAQAYYYVTGINPEGRLIFSDVRLDRAIPVDEDNGTRIEIHALVLEGDHRRSSPKIRVEIFCEQTNFSQPHFSANVELSGHQSAVKKMSSALQKAARKIIELDMKTDIYGPILFQGGPFQCIEKVHDLYYDEKKQKGECLFTSLYNKTKSDFLKNNTRHKHLLTGDPFFIDSLFQSMQMIVSQDECLPSYVDQIVLNYKSTNRHNLSLKILSKITKVDENFYIGNAYLSKGQNNIRIRDCRLKILESIPDKPTANELSSSTLRLQKFVNHKLNSIKDEFDFSSLPVIKCSIDARLKYGSKKLRHKIQRPVMLEAVNEVLINDNKPPIKKIRIKWQPSGKPVILNQLENNIHISASHCDDLLLISAGYNEQGCDVEKIIERSENDWKALLGHKKVGLLKELITFDFNLNYSGTAIWSASEVLQKFDSNQKVLQFKSGNNKFIVFKTTTGGYNLVCFILKYKQPFKIISFIIKNNTTHQTSSPNLDLLHKHGYNEKHFDIDLDYSGPQGQLVFIKKFPVVFRNNQHLSRRVYFTNYFNWIGEIREHGTTPVYEDLAKLAETGGYGMATNMVKLRILGEIRPSDTIESRLWIENITGKQKEIIDMCFEWRRISLDNRYERVAFAQQRVTMVKILGHGIAKVAELPDFLQKFFKKMLPKMKSTKPLISLPEPYKGLKLGKTCKVPFNKKVPLHKESFSSSLEDSNLVGNIYFANYAKWMGTVKDRFFNMLAPQLYRGFGEKGEFVCLNCDINYLNEAMPFDVVLVHMYLTELYKCGIDLNFHFFLVQNNRVVKKLAFSTMKIAWMKRTNNKICITPLPHDLQMHQLITD